MNLRLGLPFVTALALYAQPPATDERLMRDGQRNVTEAALQQKIQQDPANPAPHLALGNLYDHLGRQQDARAEFQKVIASATDPKVKANAYRSLAMSYAFSNDCKNTAAAEQKVADYYATVNDYYQQGEMANEAARVCIEAGDLDTAEKLYRQGTELGLKETDIKPDRVALWKFRWEHAAARLAARRGQKAEAAKHIAAARAILDQNPATAKAQEIFFPYLTGYVALHLGDYNQALADLQKANQNDPFIQCLMADAYEKLKQPDKAQELYRKASQTNAHNPPAAYAYYITHQKLRP